MSRFAAQYWTMAPIDVVLDTFGSLELSVAVFALEPCIAMLVSLMSPKT